MKKQCGGGERKPGAWPFTEFIICKTNKHTSSGLFNLPSLSIDLYSVFCVPWFSSALLEYESPTGSVKKKLGPGYLSGYRSVRFSLTMTQAGYTGWSCIIQFGWHIHNVGHSSTRKTPAMLWNTWRVTLNTRTAIILRLRTKYIILQHIFRATPKTTYDHGFATS